MSERAPHSFDASWATPSPCEGCANVKRCAAELLACRAFQHFAELKSWTRSSREPSRERFAAIFEARALDESALEKLRDQRRLTRLANGTKVGRRPKGRSSEVVTC